MAMSVDELRMTPRDEMVSTRRETTTAQERLYENVPDTHHTRRWYRLTIDGLLHREGYMSWLEVIHGVAISCVWITTKDGYVVIAA